jgi:HK97 family phage major capsid protein
MNGMDSRKRLLVERRNNLQARLKGGLNKDDHAAFQREIDRLQEDWKDFQRDKEGAERARALNVKLQGDAGNSAETKAINRPVSPLDIPVEQYRGLYEAAVKRLPSYRIDCDKMDVTTKSPFAETSFTSGTLPPTLMTSLSLDLPYEPNDAFAAFKQLTAPESRAVEYLQHTGNASPAAAVAELGNKPDIGMTLTTVTTPYVKIAALASVSEEALQDFGAFLQWVPHELEAAVRDCRTNEVVNGSGSSPHMLGILNTSGTLTRAIGSDTPVDCLRKAVNDIRVGSSYARASLILTHPTTWADLQLQKATTGAYLLNPNDPAALGDLDNIFGCRVITNTYVPAGTAIVCDPNWIYAWTRRGLTIDLNAHGTDASGTNLWVQNAVSFRAELRCAIGVARPTAVNIVTGLPSS